MNKKRPVISTLMTTIIIFKQRPKLLEQFLALKGEDILCSAFSC